MKPGHVLLYLATAVTVGALFWWWAVREPGTTGDHRGGAIAASSADIAQAPEDAGPSNAAAQAPMAGGGVSPADSTASVPRTPDGAPVRTGDPGPTAAPAGGPRPMSADNERRVAEAIPDMRLRDDHMDDLYTLLEGEGREPAWSDAAEERLAEFLRTHGAGYVALEVSPPRCSATVCEMTAVARPGSGTDVPNANWQRLLGEMYGQDWFQRDFVDQRMTMTIVDGSALYVTTFMRAEPSR